MREVKRTTETLEALKRLSERMSLDAFGTGYSRLSYLSQLPIDNLKVDQSFVRSIESDKRSRVIAETVIGMGRKLGVDVVAAGIECEEALHMLHERDRDLGQGHVLGRPMKAARFDGTVTHSTRTTACITSISDVPARGATTDTFVLVLVAIVGVYKRGPVCEQPILHDD